MSTSLATNNSAIMHNFTFYEDPGHGWLEVPIELIRMYNLKDQITSYSYMDKDNVYLEEDCDAGVLLRHLKANGIQYRIRDEYHENIFIRDLGRFQPRKV